MTFVVHRAERADRLADALGDLLADPPGDVFAHEVVAVPARGVERWLTQQLSHRLGPRVGRQDGVCAGVRFPSPGRLVATTLGVADHDPWAPDALVWPLLAVIDEAAGEPWSVLLTRHLGQDLGGGPGDAAGRGHRQGRRYAVARRIAGLFHEYASDRPAMLTDWAEGRDTDGLGTDLPADLTWEPELWRRVRAKVDAPDPLVSRRRAVHRLQTAPTPTELAELPARLSVFGPTRLSQAHLEILRALAVHRDVHLWLPHPSPALWDRLAEHPRQAGAGAPAAPAVGPAILGTRRADPTVTVPRHPLLASLGRDARELQLVLTAGGVVDSGRPDLVDRHHPPAGPPEGEPISSTPMLLGLLQQQLRDDEMPEPGRLPEIRATDHSVQVHACHGPHRQVEVLREVLVGLLDQDTSLEPRDILVMCPDIEAYAPLIAAAFGLADIVAEGAGHPGHRLRVRLADRALHQTNPLLATMGKVLDLADGRVTASQVLDLAAWGPVRRRFRFDDDDLDRLRRWVIEANVRWGLDAAHRRPFKLESFAQNTWRAGLDRILLGVAMADEAGNTLGVALPLDDVGSGDIELSGRFAELLDRLQAAADTLTGPQTLPAWLQALERAVTVLTKVASDESWQLTEVRRELADVADGAGDLGTLTMLAHSDLKALLRERLAGRPTRANFRTGTLTVCTMVPMRSVPHRVVCLLGLDDGVFPRAARVDGDDVLRRSPAVGERDPRGEDRQLMLDAILAATEHLVITYTGADERNGSLRPPAVPLGELLDTLDLTAHGTGGGLVRGQVLTRHPLQSFDSRNLTVSGDPGATGRVDDRPVGTGGRPFSYDPAALSGARAARGARDPRPPFLSARLPAGDVGDVELADLVALLTHPVKGFLRQRLDLAIRYDEDDPQDSLTVDLDGLQQWSIGDRLLRQRLSGIDEQACRDAEWRRGLLPPGPLGDRTLGEVLRAVQPLVERSLPLRQEPARTVDLSVDLTGGRQLRGTVAGVHGSTVLQIGYAKLGVRPQLSAWIQLLALTAGRPDTAWTAIVIGRGKATAPRTATFGPLEAVQARVWLAQLIALYDAGLRAPLPLPLKTSEAYAGARQWNPDTAEAIQAARSKWESGKFPGDDADHSHQRVWGPKAPLSVLMSARPGEAERWTGEQSRFGELARRLWTPLLEHRVDGTL